MSIKLVLTLILLTLTDGYCSSAQQRAQPKPPPKVSGWKDDYSGGVHSIGEFLLRKGESTNNGKIGVEVVDIITPKSGAEGYAGEPKVALRFYRPDDQQTICEATFTEGGTTLGTGPPYPYCKPEVGLSAISVNAINTKDAWVWFDLRMYESQAYVGGY